MDIRVTRFIDRHAGIPICILLSFVDKLQKLLQRLVVKQKKPHPIRKILLMKFWGLGNIILATPAINAIRKKHPDAQIDFLTLAENRNLVEALPEINRVIDIKLKGIFAFIKDFVKLLINIRKLRYDAIIDFETFARSSSILSYLSRAPIRIGFDTPLQGRGGLYSISVAYKNNQHIVKTFYDLAQAFGCEKSELILSKLQPKNEIDHKTIQEILERYDMKHEKLVGIHVGTGPNATTRRWPLHNYCRLIELLIKEYRVKIIFTGGQAEKNTVEQILKKIRSLNKNCIDVCCRLTIPQLALLMNQMKLFISSDTGPLHLAAAQGINTISFYGPNTPHVYGPWGDKKKNIVIYKQLKCSPCMSNYNDKLSRCIYKEPFCITTITPSEVIEQIRLNELLKNQS